MHTERFPLPGSLLATYAFVMDGLRVRHPAVPSCSRRRGRRASRSSAAPRGASRVPARTSFTRTSTARSATSAPACSRSVDAGDGSGPVPGWTDDHEWDGWIAFDELPWAVDPRSGYLVTANNRIHDDGYPHLIGHRLPRAASARAAVVERLEEVALHDVASMGADPVRTPWSLPARRRAPGGCSRSSRRRDDERDASGLLAGWDGDDVRGRPSPRACSTCGRATSPGSALQPRLGEDLFRRYHVDREVFQCEVLPAWLRDPAGWLDDELLRAAPADALAELRERLGPDPSAWRWGALHHVALVHPLGLDPGSWGAVRGRDDEVGGDEQTVMQGGFDGLDGHHGDRDRLVARRSPRPRPTSTGPSACRQPACRAIPASPALERPVFPLWIAGGHHPLPLTSPAVEAARGSPRCRLLPG